LSLSVVTESNQTWPGLGPVVAGREDLRPELKRDESKVTRDEGQGTRKNLRLGWPGQNVAVTFSLAAEPCAFSGTVNIRLSLLHIIQLKVRLSMASPLAKWLPYSISRTWHIQIAIFWIATSWLATGLFYAPAIC